MEQENCWNSNQKAANEKEHTTFQCGVFVFCWVFFIWNWILRVHNIKLFIVQYYSLLLKQDLFGSQSTLLYVFYQSWPVTPSFTFLPTCVFKLVPTPPHNLVFMVIFTVSQVDLVRLASQRLFLKNRPAVWRRLQRLTFANLCLYLQSCLSACGWTW